MSSLTEMPITNFQRIGDFDRASSMRHKTDRQLLTAAKPIQKLHDRFAKTGFNFNFYFVNLPEGRNHAEVGFVTHEWLERNLPTTAEHVPADPDAITVIFTNNTGAERLPLTPWIIAHRIGHAIRRTAEDYRAESAMIEAETELVELTERTLALYGIDVRKRLGFGDKGILSITNWERPYQRMAKYLYQQIGTMRSARKAKLRDQFEFIYELLAQYLLTGSIKFNPLPKMLITSYSYGRPRYVQFGGNDMDYEYYNYELESMTEVLEQEFDRALNRAIGKILVM